MFIGITGPLCAGRNTLAQYLVDRHSFQPLRISDDHDQHGDTNILPGTKVFPTASELIEFVTVNWQNDYVVCNLHDIQDLELAR
jgi:dCMP deaminase